MTVLQTPNFSVNLVSLVLVIVTAVASSRIFLDYAQLTAERLELFSLRMLDLISSTGCLVSPILCLSIT